MSEYTTVILADSPAAYYRLDEASGTSATDSSGNSHTGTYAGSYTQNVAGCLLCDTDTAWLINSTTAKVTLPSALNQNSSSAFSVEFWIKPTNNLPSSGSYYIFHEGPYNGSTQGLNIYQFNNSGTSQIAITVANGTTNKIASANFSLVAGSIYHIVGTYDGTNARLYINGALKSTSATLAGPCVNSGSPTIGNPAANDFQGVVDEFAIYNSVLSLTQIGNHYAAGNYQLLGITRPKFYTRVGGLISYTRNKFYDKMVLVGMARDNFFTKLASLLTRTVDQFTRIAPLASVTRNRFVTRVSPLVSITRDKFTTSRHLAGLWRNKFYVGERPFISGVAAFKTKVGQSTKARDKFSPTFPRFYTYAWDRFLLPAFILKNLARNVFRIGKPLAIKAALKSQVQHINVKFTEVAVSNPNTTIDVSCTVTDMNNFVVPNLTSAIVTVFFPDGSSSIPITATNMGSGVYTVTYTTKGPGIQKELWSFLAVTGATAQYINVIPITY